jgi:hypothetical protein
VQADRLEPGRPPRRPRPLCYGVGERGLAAPAEHELGARAPGAKAMARELGPQGGAQQDPPPPGPALRLDRPGLLVPASLDPQDTTLKVDVRPAKPLELAAAKPGVEGGGPERALAGPERGQEVTGLSRAGDPLERRAPRGARARASG